MKFTVEIDTNKIEEASKEIRDDVRPLIYISGPMMSEGHPYANIGDAIELGEIAYDRGWAPIIPHLDCLVSMVTGNTDRRRYLETDRAILARCSAVALLPYSAEESVDPVTGEVVQSGTAEEIEFAQDIGLPIYTEETIPYVG